MSRFTSLYNKILKSSSLLTEMPVATAGLAEWKRGILSRLGVGGRKGWIDANLRTKYAANQGDVYHHNLYCFDTLAENLVAKINSAIQALRMRGVIATREDVTDSVDAILQVSKLNGCTASASIKECIVDGFANLNPASKILSVSEEWFKNLVISLVADTLFDYIFISNTENISVRDYYGRSSDVKHQGVLSFYNPSLTEAIFIEQIQQALQFGKDDKPSVLLKVANDLGITYTLNKNDIKATAKLLAQCREEIVADYKTGNPNEI